jgi:N-acetylmuramoyl-L-alanine amidase
MINKLLIVLFCCALSLWFLSFIKADDCIKKPLKIAIDIGHSAENYGALSAYGVTEYEFNKKIAHVLHNKLIALGYDAIIIDSNLELSLRTHFIAVTKRVDLLISLHHDSVQAKYLKSWNYQGKELKYSDDFSGFSIFVSKANDKLEESLLFASLLSDNLININLTPSLHHAEDIEGENKFLIDDKRGIYYYNELLILKSDIPSVLLECGIIVNRNDEKILNSDKFRQKTTDAIIDAIQKYNKAREAC